MGIAFISSLVTPLAQSQTFAICQSKLSSWQRYTPFLRVYLFEEEARE